MWDSGGINVARFERLRWVPMLIRAYYDAEARLRNQAEKGFPQSPVTEAHRQDTGRIAPNETSTRSPHHPQARRKARARMSSQRIGQKRTVRAAHSGKRRQPETRTSTSTGTTSTRSTASGSTASGSTLSSGPQIYSKARLLRELRAANQKLRSLDEMRQQLNGIGLSLEEFGRRLDEWSEKSTMSNSQVTAPSPLPRRGDETLDAPRYPHGLTMQPQRPINPHSGTHPPVLAPME